MGVGWGAHPASAPRPLGPQRTCPWALRPVVQTAFEARLAGREEPVVRLLLLGLPSGPLTESRTLPESW